MPTRKRREREQAKVAARRQRIAEEVTQEQTRMRIELPSKLGILRGIGTDEQVAVEQRLARLEADMKASQVHRLDVGCGAVPTPQNATSRPPGPPPLLQRIEMLENEYAQFRAHVINSLDEHTARIVRLETALGL